MPNGWINYLFMTAVSCFQGEILQRISCLGNAFITNDLQKSCLLFFDQQEFEKLSIILFQAEKSCWNTADKHDSLALNPFAHFPFGFDSGICIDRTKTEKSLNYRKIEIGTFLSYTELFVFFFLLLIRITHDLFERKDIPRHGNQWKSVG